MTASAVNETASQVFFATAGRRRPGANAQGSVWALEFRTISSYRRAAPTDRRTSLNAPQESAMALVQSIAKRARAMPDRSEPSSIPGVARINVRCLPTSGVWSSTGAETTQFDNAAQLATFAVITVRNDTRSPVKCDLRILPDFPRFLTFHLHPGQQRTFLSAFQPGTDSPQFEVEFLSIPGRAHTHTAQTLTEFNVLRTQLNSPIDHEDGRLYVFQATAGGRDLFLD
jgi:hypothetical protein